MVIGYDLDVVTVRNVVNADVYSYSFTVPTASTENPAFVMDSRTDWEVPNELRKIWSSRSSSTSSTNTALSESANGLFTDGSRVSCLILKQS